MSDLTAKLAGRRVVASISGGKDSAALSLWLKEQGIDHDRVFMDTGWEHESTYGYLRGELTRVLGPIVEVRAARGMVEGIRAHGMFPSRGRQWCTKELKIEPLAAHLATFDDPINAVGVRGEESEKRRRMTEWEWSDDLDCETWRPLLGWTFADVVAIHKRHGLAPNPLYIKGANRVGCWPCINARKPEIKLLAETDPDRVAFLGRLEVEISARRGAPRAFFNGKTGRGTVAPIEAVAAWAKGDPRQIVVLQDDEPGCMKWGVCESEAAA